MNDLNDEAPVFTSASSFTVDENTTAVGTVVATDADANTTLSYSLGGTDAASLHLIAHRVFWLYFGTRF